MPDASPPHEHETRRDALERIARQQPDSPTLDAPPSPPQVPYARSSPAPAVDESPMWTLIAAILFLYVGFYVAYAPLNNQLTVYNVSLTGFTWMARIVGVGLLGVAAMAFVRVPGVRALDFVLAVMAAVGCLATGLIWVLHRDNDGFLVGLFGLVNAMAARSAWYAWKGRAVS